MLTFLKQGIGSFGKLWTGDRFPAPPENDSKGLLANAVAILMACPECGSTTRQLKLSTVATVDKNVFPFLPNLFIATGGVGSYVPAPADKPEPSERFWNWGGCEGGRGFFDPIAVISGRSLDVRALPAPALGAKWYVTYHGNTLSEAVLQQPYAEQELEADVEISRSCPVCKEKEAHRVEKEKAKRQSRPPGHQAGTGRSHAAEKAGCG